MKSLTNSIHESLVTESKTVCGLCPTFTPETPNQKEFEKIFKPIFDKLKKGADKYAYLAGEAYAVGERDAVDAPDLAAVIKASMDFLIRNLGNIEDDCRDSGNNDNFLDKMQGLFSGDFNEYIKDDVYRYCPDFRRYGTDLDDYVATLHYHFNVYCKKVVGMPWR